jgi:hypothetical protein
MRQLHPRLLATLISITLVGLGAPDGASAQGGVLVIGDSLEVGTGPYLRQELADVQVTVDARESRPSGDGLTVLRSRLSPEHSVVVFDLGVNDDPAQPDTLAADLAAARAAVADRCLVVATLTRPPYRGVSIEGLNGAITEFVASSPPAELADWRSAALSTPGALQPDGVHGTPAGYALRAQVVAEAVYACLAGESEHQGGAGLGVAEPRSGLGELRPQPSPGPLALLMSELGHLVVALADRLATAAQSLLPWPISRGSV